MKAIIVDDEVRGAKTLAVLLSEYCKEIEVISMAHSLEEAVKCISQLAPEVVFLDIEMPDGNGFELLEKFPQHGFQVIFTTAYDHFAVQAFKTNAVSYLLKPIDADELIIAVSKLKQRNDESQTLRMANIENALIELKAKTKQNTRLAIHGVEGILFIEIDKIVRLEADSNYTHIFLVGGKKITSSKTLKEYETSLTQNNFFRVHNAHVVNLAHIERYIKGEGGYVVTMDGVTIEVSRRRKAELMEVLGKLG